MRDFDLQKLLLLSEESILSESENVAYMIKQELKLY